MSRPYAPGRVAIETWLAKNVGDLGDIADATGQSRDRIRSVISELRQSNSRLLENYVRRNGAPDPKPDVPQIVASALASRTALEQVWGQLA